MQKTNDPLRSREIEKKNLTAVFNSIKGSSRSFWASANKTVVLLRFCWITCAKKAPANNMMHTILLDGYNTSPHARSLAHFSLQHINCVVSPPPSSRKMGHCVPSLDPRPRKALFTAWIFFLSLLVALRPQN